MLIEWYQNILDYSTIFALVYVYSWLKYERVSMVLMWLFWTGTLISQRCLGGCINSEHIFIACAENIVCGISWLIKIPWDHHTYNWELASSWLIEHYRI